jgi:hypothetical protein
MWDVGCGGMTPGRVLGAGVGAAWWAVWGCVEGGILGCWVGGMDGRYGWVRWMGRGHGWGWDGSVGGGLWRVRQWRGMVGEVQNSGMGFFIDSRSLHSGLCDLSSGGKERYTGLLRTKAWYIFMCSVCYSSARSLV